jgi:quercetin dioxygenase-like cupin family protein
MVEQGQTIDNPIMGGRIVFRETAASSHGELLSMEFTLAAGGVIAEEHVHPVQRERFEVISGRLDGSVNGVAASVKAGESSEVEAGVPHNWWNAGGDAVCMVLEFLPALRTEDFFHSVFQLAADGQTNAKGVPRFWYMALLLDQYHEEFRPARLSPWMARTFSRLAAPIARRRGYSLP